MSLSMQHIISQAIESIRNNFSFFLGITLLFFTLNILVELTTYGLSINRFAPMLFFSIISLALYVKHAVVVHRTVILGEANRWDRVFTWGVPESSFFVLSVVLWFLFALFLGVMTLIMSPFLYASASAVDQGVTFFRFFALFVFVIAGLAFTYLCLMFPSRAVGLPMSFTNSIHKTKTNYFKVLLLVVFIPITTGIMIDYLMSEDTLVYNLFINLIAHFLLVFQVSILSHTYLTLVGSAESESPD